MQPVCLHVGEYIRLLGLRHTVICLLIALILTIPYMISVTAHYELRCGLIGSCRVPK